MEILSRGAEATIFIDSEKLIVTKVRDEKKYRIEPLDKKLRLTRTRKEFKILNKLYDNHVRVPRPIEINESKFSFDMEFINGTPLKDVLTEKYLKECFTIIMEIHNLDIVHFDLTTLNFLVKDDKVFLIDFGLSSVSSDIENKAVDLNMFFNCIKNEHNSFYIFKRDLENIYKSKVNFGDKILDRLRIVESRGRNKNK